MSVIAEDVAEEWGLLKLMQSAKDEADAGGVNQNMDDRRTSAEMKADHLCPMP